MDAQVALKIGTGTGFFIRAVHICGKVFFLGPCLRNAKDGVSGYSKKEEAILAVRRLLKADEKDGFSDLEYSIVDGAGNEI